VEIGTGNQVRKFAMWKCECHVESLCLFMPSVLHWWF